MCKEELLNRVETSSSWQEVPPQAQMRQSGRTTLRVSLQVFLFIGFDDTDDGETLHIHTFCSRRDGGATPDSRRETFFKEKNQRHNMVCTLRRVSVHSSRHPSVSQCSNPPPPNKRGSSWRICSRGESNFECSAAAFRLRAQKHVCPVSHPA